MLAEHGISVEPDDVRRLSGCTESQLFTAFAERGPLPPEAETLAAVAARMTEAPAPR